MYKFLDPCPNSWKFYLVDNKDIFTLDCRNSYNVIHIRSDFSYSTDANVMWQLIHKPKQYFKIFIYTIKFEYCYLNKINIANSMFSFLFMKAEKIKLCTTKKADEKCIIKLTLQYATSCTTDIVCDKLYNWHSMHTLYNWHSMRQVVQMT